MQDLPHYYHVNASAEAEGNVTLKANEVPQLVTAPPAEFGGPGDQWSPETLLVPRSRHSCMMVGPASRRRRTGRSDSHCRNVALSNAVDRRA